MAPGALLTPDYITGVIRVAHSIDIERCYSNRVDMRTGVVPIELRCFFVQSGF